MTDVTGVRARPGGRVTLRFTGTGYRALPQPNRLEIWGDRLLGDASTGISLVVLIVFGGLAAYLWQEDAKPVSVMLLVICVPCVLVLLVRAAVESVGWLFLAAAVAGAVLFFPLLVFPGIRKKAKEWWTRKPAESHVGKRILVTDLEPVAVERNGRAVTVTVLVDGARIRYTARDGDALEREFRAMMSGVGP